MQIFISYAHQDRPKVNSLAMQLRQAGIDTWVDSELMGGQVWWDKILAQLRSCDTIIVAVSRYSLSSDACRAERRYAMALGKTVLPLIIEPMGTDLLPPEIARLQVIDYSEPSETAAFQLVGAILKLPPAKPLPEPPPEPPPVPFSYIHELAEQVSLPQLNLDQQLAIIGRLEGACDDPVNRETAISLLRQMSSRQDLYAAPSKRVDYVPGQSRNCATAAPGSTAAGSTAAGSEEQCTWAASGGLGRHIDAASAARDRYTATAVVPPAQSGPAAAAVIRHPAALGHGGRLPDHVLAGRDRGARFCGAGEPEPEQPGLRRCTKILVPRKDHVLGKPRDISRAIYYHHRSRSFVEFE